MNPIKSAILFTLVIAVIAQESLTPPPKGSLNVENGPTPSPLTPSDHSKPSAPKSPVIQSRFTTPLPMLQATNQPNVPTSLPMPSMEMLQSLIPMIAKNLGSNLSVPQLMTAMFGLMATGRIAPVLIPILVRFLVLPAMGMVRAVARSMVYFGVISYLFSAAVPALLSYLGLIGGSAFVGRAQQSSSWIIQPVNEFLNNRLVYATEGVLNYMDMGSSDCKLMLTCKVGRFMVKEHPKFADHMKQYGIESMIRSSNSNNNRTMVLLNSMNGEDDCSSYVCPNYNQFESYLHTSPSEINEKIVELTTTTTTTTTTETPTTLNDIRIPDEANNLMKVLAEFGSRFLQSK